MLVLWVVSPCIWILDHDLRFWICRFRFQLTSTLTEILTEILSNWLAAGKQKVLLTVKKYINLQPFRTSSWRLLPWMLLILSHSVPLWLSPFHPFHPSPCKWHQSSPAASLISPHPSSIRWPFSLICPASPSLISLSSSWHLSALHVFTFVHSPHSGCPGPWPCARQCRLRSWWLHAACPRCGTTNTNTWSIKLRFNGNILVQPWAYRVMTMHHLEQMWSMWDRNALKNLENTSLIHLCHRIWKYLEECTDIDWTANVLHSQTACWDALQIRRCRDTGLFIK